MQHALTVVGGVEDAELLCVLWAACDAECATVGDEVVRAICAAVAYEHASELEVTSGAVRAAAIELIACASLVVALANAHAAFVLREGRGPSALALVREAYGGGAVHVGPALSLASAFLAQRIAC